MKTSKPVKPSGSESPERQLGPMQTIRASGGAVIKNVKQRITTIYNQFDDKLLRKVRLELRLLFVALVLIVIGLTIYLINRSRPQDDGGLFRIAVAGFAEMGQLEKSGIGMELASHVHDALKKELNRKEAQPLYPKILPLEDIRPVTGDNDEEVNRSAQNAAEECDAHLLVYGSVKEIDSNRWEISPRFWVHLENAHELEGQHRFGKPFPVDAFSRENAEFQPGLDVRSQFSKRTWSFANIAAGLAFYARGKYRQASERFLSIEENGAWNYIEEEGKELLYVFLGNTAGKLEEYDSAEKYFIKALDCDNESPRANLGLANIYINRAADKDKTVDYRHHWLKEAFKAYGEASVTKNQTFYPYMTIKIDFGLGKCYCLRGFMSSNCDDLERAISKLEAVIAAYNNSKDKDDEIKQLASKAKKLLDLINSHLERQEHARDG